MLHHAYLQKVVENLGPKSREQRDPHIILKEWVATGSARDNETASECCGVCDQVDCRYMFEIANRHTNMRVESGSVCILHFSEITYRTSSGEELVGNEKRDAMQDALNRLKTATSKKKRLGIIGDVKAGIEAIPRERQPQVGTKIFHEACDIIYSCVENEQKITPNDFAIFMWALKETQAIAPLSAFRGMISLRERKNKDYLVVMAAEKTTRWRYEIFRSALTQEQRRALRRHHEKTKQ